MAIFKLVKKTYDYKSDMWRVIDYCRKQATCSYSPNMHVYSTMIMYNEFMYWKNFYHEDNDDGDKLLHFVLSFDSSHWERWVSCQTALYCAMKICGMDAFEGFQNVAFIHPKKGQLHIHFLVNTINYATGRQCRFYMEELKKEAAQWLSLEHIALLSVSYFDEKGCFRLGRHDEDSLYLNSPLCNNGLYKTR